MSISISFNVLGDVKSYLEQRNATLFSCQSCNSTPYGLRDGCNFTSTQMSTGRKILTDILRRIIFLHANKIIHRDIKPANLLLDESHRVVKITNFGLAKRFPGSESTTTRCGSPYYQAFEQVTDSYDFRVDIFSVGVVM